jgi:hypothetical protein
MARSAQPVGFLVMRLPQALRGLFKSEDDPALLLDHPTAAAATAPSPASAPASRRQIRSDKARLKSFENRLHSLTAASSPSEPLIAGRLQIIALSRVKERLGEDWARLATRVHRLTRQILERRLADEDVYVQAGDCYVILFARLTGIEATFKAQAITREITALLIGDLPEVEEAPIRMTIHEIDPCELRAEPTLESLVARMDAAAARETATIDDGGAGAPRRAEPGPAQFDYLPIWSRRGRAIVGYLCRRRQGAQSDEGDPYDLDCLALRTVLAALPDMERDGRAALVVAPVHWDTLVQLQRRQSYLDLCRQAPLQLNRRLAFAISDVAAGAWRDLICDRLLPLKPFARLFLVRVPPEPAQIRHLADIGVDALAFELAPAGAFDDAHRQRVLEFARDAARHRLATCALGVDRRSTALDLLAAGVDFLGGKAIAPRVGAPGAAYRLDLTADPDGTDVSMRAPGG